MNSFGYLLLIFLFSCLRPLSAQQSELDSLKLILDEAKQEDRVKILNALATNLREIEQDLAFQYSLEAEKLSQELGLKADEAKAKENIGWVYYRRGQWQKTFEYSEKSYQLAVEAGDQAAAARVLNNMGALYYEQHDFPMAISQFKKAFEISAKTEDLFTQIRSLNNIGYNFSQLGEMDSALFYAKKAVRINEEAGSPYMTSFSNRVIGDVYLYKNQLDSAEYIYELSLKMAQIQGLVSFEASVLHRLGNVYLLLGKLDNAEKMLKRGIEISSANNLLDELSKNHKHLFKVYAKRGNIKEAFFHQGEYMKIYDSLVNRSNRDRIALMQGIFQDNLEKSELELLKAQNKNQADRLEFTHRIIWVISVAGILILALGIRLVSLNRSIKKINKDLVDQKQKINQQKQDLEQKSQELEEINQTKNKLFSILGHDLRGPVGQVKSAVDLVLKGRLEKDEFNELLLTLKKDVDSVYFTLTNTLKWSVTQMDGFKVNPSRVNHKEIVDSSLRLLAAQLKEKDIKIQVQISEDQEVYLDGDLIEVVIRNILNNAAKFSKAGGKIQVTSTVNEKSLILCVMDEGVGMTQDQIDQILIEKYVITTSQPGTNQERGSGLGLQVCKELVCLINGKLSIESELGVGTKVCVEFPLKNSIVKQNLVEF